MEMPGIGFGLAYTYGFLHGCVLQALEK